MEGLASNFERVLEDFTERLRGASYVAVDMELTGIDISTEPDTFSETASERLNKLCRIAEQYIPIQIGFTIVSMEGSELKCASYNFFAFPWTGPELLGHAPAFVCQASALQFNGKTEVDFNKWIKEGVPYMTRQAEARYLQSKLSAGDTQLPRKVGLLRLWKVLCDAYLPLVVHCPLDLFFLLACFEQQKLPGESPQEIAMLVQQCFPCVFDTAYLHGFVGGFKRLGLSEFHREAKARYEKEADSNCDIGSFVLEARTSQTYAGVAKIHEAAYDSLLTAQLFAYLNAISSNTVNEAANRLFLYKSLDCLDLSNAAAGQEIGVHLFDSSRETPLVGTLAAPNDKQALSSISRAGFKYTWMDSLHVMIIVQCCPWHATDEADRLSMTTQGIQWIPFGIWQTQDKSLDLYASDSAERATNTDSFSEGSSEVQSSPSSSTASPTTSHTVSVSLKSARAWLDGAVEKQQRSFTIFTNDLGQPHEVDHVSCGQSSTEDLHGSCLDVETIASGDFFSSEYDSSDGGDSGYVVSNRWWREEHAHCCDQEYRDQYGV